MMNHGVLPPALKDFVQRNAWTFAKTMPDSPHEYIVRDRLLEGDQRLFDEFAELINSNGYSQEYRSRLYTYYDIGPHKYWVIENILNRTEKIRKLSATFYKLQNTT